MSGQKSSCDYLSSLPSELLDDIFHYAHDYSEPLTTPLSKGLLPFQRHSLFQILNVHSYQALGNLCELAQSQPDLMVYARILNIELAFAQESRTVIRESQDPNSPSNEVIKLLFQQLVNVTLVSVEGSTRIVHLVMETAVAKSSFQVVNSLSIVSTLADVADPFHPSDYGALQHYPQLKKVDIVVLRKQENIQASRERSPNTSPSLPRILNLTLHGPLTVSSSSVKSLIASFGSLATLNLVDSTPIASILDFLDVLAHPEILQQLTLAIDRYDVNVSVPVGCLSTKARYLSGLKSLEIEGGCSSTSTSFYSSLYLLPLETLTLDGDFEVSLPELSKLVTGKTKHRTLKKIQLHNVAGSIGTRITDQGVPYDNSDWPDWTVYPDWHLPNWTVDCSEQGLVDFIRLAESEGISVSGTAVEAIGINDEYEKEFEKLEEFGPRDG